eukprot:Sspe_Gene.42580::Locus_20688_Transcript_1_1_Confidence_1.000_Length_3018::g.42580::m.42580/K05728/CSK; c-src tyrosine kinase
MSLPPPPLPLRGSRHVVPLHWRVSFFSGRVNRSPRAPPLYCPPERSCTTHHAHPTMTKGSCVAPPPFSDALAAVAALERPYIELHTRKQLTALHFRAMSCHVQSDKKKLNLLLYHLREAMRHGDFCEMFVVHGGVDKLLLIVQVADPTIQAETYRTLMQLSMNPSGALALAKATYINELAAVLPFEPREDDVTYWLTSVRFSLQALAAVASTGKAGCALVYELSHKGSASLRTILSTAATRRLEVVANVFAFILVLYCGLDDPSGLVAMLRRAGIPAALVAFRHVEDCIVRALCSLAAFVFNRAVAEDCRPFPRANLPCVVAEALRGWHPANDVQPRITEALAAASRSVLGIEHQIDPVWDVVHLRLLHDEEAGYQAILLQRTEEEVGLMELSLPQDHFVRHNQLQGLKQVGQGSFGVVFRATAEHTMETVAVKELKFSESDAPLRRLRKKRAFLLEVLGLHTLRNNAILNFYGWSLSPSNDTLWMVTEYCPGGSLNERCRRESRKGELSVKVGLQIAQALLYLHSRSKVHLDVAARNILIASSDVFKLADMGLLSTEGTPAPVFSIPWAPPEAMQEGYRSSRCHDVWSFGVMLWEVLEGGVPYPRLSVREVMEEVKALRTLPIPLAARTCVIAQAVWRQVVQPLWVTDPKERPDMRTIMGHLLSIQREDAIPGERDSLSPKAPDDPYEGFSPAPNPYSVDGALQDRFDVVRTLD